LSEPHRVTAPALTKWCGSLRLQLRLRNTAFFGFHKNFFAKIFAQICVFVFAKISRYFCANHSFSFLRKFSRKSEFLVFAKILRHFRENFRENQSFSFSQKIFAKILRYFRENYTRFSRKFSQKTKYFRETKFREISRKSAHFRITFAFSRKLKNAFSFQPWFYGNILQIKGTGFTSRTPCLYYRSY
jgi:hypothetical protein